MLKVWILYLGLETAHIDPEARGRQDHNTRSPSENWQRSRARPGIFTYVEPVIYPDI